MSYLQLVRNALQSKGIRAQDAGDSLEPLSQLDYKTELSVKNIAFEKFWKENQLPLKPEPIVASPRPRAYRTTTKRRVEYSSRGLYFTHGDGSPDVHSELEPEAHGHIYQFLGEKIDMPVNRPLALALNWLIIRGNYREFAVIFNVHRLDASVVRRLKALAEQLHTSPLGVTAGFMYFDPTRSDYYLEAERPKSGVDFKHLFGPRLLSLEVNSTIFKYHPTGFSQINESMVPIMVNTAKGLLSPTPQDTLLDLYCGYGLFSHTLGADCDRVQGIELSPVSIESAREISKRLGHRHMRFDVAMIDKSLVESRLAAPKTPELILLDPPRKGTEPGVIEALARRKPKAVLQISCGTDELPAEVRRWLSAGYQIQTVVPLDMFPGSANLETLVLFC